MQSVGSSFKNAENLIQSILNATDSPDPNLVVMTGDQVDRGGYEQQWIDYYNYVPSLGNLLQATVPGNHEYYFSSNGSVLVMKFIINFTIILQMVQVDRLGSSYYFVWDQILFIMLDTVKTDYNVAQQQEWFRNVVKNNPTQWIIVGSHRFIATGTRERYTNHEKVVKTI
ncbi:MAG: metallophosphoesterase family protein [Christensenellales bacterium]